MGYMFAFIFQLSQGINENDFVDLKAFFSGRTILLIGALSSVVCMSIYTAGLASRIASIKQIDPTIDGLHDLGYTWVLTRYQVTYFIFSALMYHTCQYSQITTKLTTVSSRMNQFSWANLTL